MGEVLVSREGGGGMTEMMAESPELITRTNDGGLVAMTTDRVFRWEKFLPRMVFRVLLVEADDSTRHIITALLRKCNYKVAAVSDGLKAWEVLKGRPHNIDLIITEVELPSISGFALLTLIMEHEVCKKIPVIMMSKNDSISTVHKCMLRGAADFLVKPVRKNELKNLWQHVWRRQTSTSGGNGPHEESDAQQKVEATAENNAISNHSSGYMACIKRNRECIEKGSDAQSSCRKPDMEAEGPVIEELTDIPQSQWATSLSSDKKKQKFEEYVRTNNQLRTQGNDAEGSVVVDRQKVNASTQEKDIRLEHVNVVDANLATYNPSREAIDLIGSFDNFRESSYRSSLNYGTNKVDHSSPILDLSLRRSHLSSAGNQISDEKHKLKQSDASAFSRYINRTQSPLPCISNQQKGFETNSNKQLSKNSVENHCETRGVPMGSTQQNTISQHGQAEIQSQFPSPKERVFPIPVAMRGLRFENPGATYGSVLPPIFCVQAGLLPMQNPNSCHQEPSSFQENSCSMSNPEARIGSQELHNLIVDRQATKQTEKRQGRIMETLEDRGHLSSVSDHSGSNGHVNIVSDGNNTHRSIQREAALNKFRMKRKDRCYDKKVRYESRRKLAEQRPRVRGQFVRQLQTCNSTYGRDTESLN